MSPSHAYASAGTYSAVLKVTDAAGGSGSSTSSVTVLADPVAQAGGPYTGSVGKAIGFNAAASTGPDGQTLSYSWAFGDGGGGIGVSPTHTYTTAGNYSAVLTVTDGESGVGTSSAAVAVLANPVAVAGGPYLGSVGQAVNFSSSASTGPPGQTLFYSWTFGDGTTGSGPSPTHIYSATGNYTVGLTVTDGASGVGTAAASVTVIADPVAVAGGPYTGSVGQAISFNAAASSGPAGQTLSYAWAFGDGTTGNGATPLHTYINPGTYTATVTVTDPASGIATSTAAVAVLADPVASAGGPYTGSVGQPVSFNASASSAPTGQYLSYSWNFGDGTSGTGAAPTHAYSSPGTFTASVTTTDAVNGIATASAPVLILTDPVAVAGGPYTGSVGEAVTFSASGSTGPTGQTLSYAWSFGDGTTGSGIAPIHAYSTVGSYNASLTVTDGINGVGTATTAVTVLSAPVAVAGGPYTGSAGQPIIFNASASTAPSGQTLSFAWAFGDGASGSGATPTHSYSSAGSYMATVTVSDGASGSASSTSAVTVLADPIASAGGPYSGAAGQAISFDGSGSTAPAGQTLTYLWAFGDGSAGSGATPTHSYVSSGSYTATLTVTDGAGGVGSSTALVTVAAPLTILSFTPSSGPVGTIVALNGTSLVGSGGTATQVGLTQQGGGTIVAPVSGLSANSLTFVIPSGAATGPVAVTVGSQSAASSGPLTVTTSSTYSVSVAPTAITLLQGQSTALAVTLSSSSGFTGSANLSVTGLPSGVTSSFKPPAIAVGQTSILTLTAPSGQAVGTTNLTVASAATIDSQSVTQSATASLKIATVTTTFQGRTVVDDAAQEPIAGVTVKFVGTDDKGNSTGCSGQALSDGGGNFQLSNLSAACIGPQLISYDGSTATTPAGKYAGVNLSYTLVSGQVTSSPVLIHLPRIDNAETVEVQQNFATDQVFYFHTIPGLKVTVYAGTTLSLDDGSQPNPFPLVAIEIPLDRLPDKMATTGMLNPFIVAFQPANAVASMPVAVNFPNTLSTPAGSHVTFVTLDPTHGYMVPYGTGTVSSDGSEFVADSDPSHPGHGYGLVHFDWHGPMPPPPSSINPSMDGGGVGSQGGGGSQSGGQTGSNGGSSTICGCTNPTPPSAGGPVDLSSGIVSYTATDLKLSSARGSIAINRYYRTLATYQGPFGIGTSHDYSYTLNTFAFVQGQGLITLVTPDGNQFAMSANPQSFLIEGVVTPQLTNTPFTNNVVPALRGATLTAASSSGPFTLRWANGTQYVFTIFTSLGSREAFLTSITDLNGNTTNLTLNPNQPSQILAITDPVGRSFSLVYDSSNRVTQITDPAGRKVMYAYNGQGTLQTFTDANGGKTTYGYDTANNLNSITDPRSIVTEQDVYNESFDGRVTQQTEADGGIYQFAYTLQNPGVPTSPVIQTVVTDPLGNQTTYRFDTQGFLQSATDPSGQTRVLTRDPAHNNLVSSYTGAGVCPSCGNPATGDVSFTFDQIGNTLSQTDSLGNKTSYTYDGRFNKVSSVTDALNHTMNIVYDSNGNPTSITDANGNATQLAYDSFGELTGVTDPAGAKTAIAYDSYGNISSVTDALGHQSNLTYDAVSRLIQSTDALGRVSKTVYDALNRITSRTDPRGNTTTFTYDGIGDLLSFKDAKNNTTQYTYDSVGRLYQRTSPLNATETYLYDVDSNLIQYTDRRTQVSKFTYDPLNRLLNETYFDATVARTYDARGHLVSVNDSQGGIFGFAYDADGHLLTQQEPTGVVNYTRDALGRVNTRQVAGQAKVQYAYDPVGNMLSAAMPAIGVSFTYDTRNLPKVLTRTNGVVTNYTFDPLGQVLSIIHSNGATSLNTQNYTYDAVGNRSIISNDLGQALTTQSASGTVDANNQLNTFGMTTYQYDANGNRETETSPTTSLTYTWDGRNRLASITDGSGSKTSMAYDFARNLLRVVRGAGGASTEQDFVFDSLTNVASLTDTSGTIYSLLSGQGIDTHYASTNGSSMQFGITDAVGSVVGTTDGAGRLTSQVSYDPYGQPALAARDSFPFAYAGRISVTSSASYFRNRFYDATSSRFISEDPLGFLAGPNKYAYTSGNPISTNDPYGLTSESDNQLNDFINQNYGAGTANDVKGLQQSQRNELRADTQAANVALLASPIGDALEIGAALKALEEADILAGALSLGSSLRSYSDSLFGGGIIDSATHLGNPDSSSLLSNKAGVCPK